MFQNKLRCLHTFGPDFYDHIIVYDHVLSFLFKTFQSGGGSGIYTTTTTETRGVLNVVCRRCIVFITVKLFGTYIQQLSNSFIFKSPVTPSVCAYTSLSLFIDTVSPHKRFLSWGKMCKPHCE